MKINKNILTTTTAKVVISAFAVVVALSIMIGTLFFAQQYTSTHSSKSNSFQGRNGTRPQGEFRKKDGVNAEGGPPSGDMKKPGN